jgi:hypothetical protein
MVPAIAPSGAKQRTRRQGRSPPTTMHSRPASSRVDGTPSADANCPLMVNCTLDLPRRQSTDPCRATLHRTAFQRRHLNKAKWPQCLDAAGRLTLPGELRFLRWLGTARLVGLLLARRDRRSRSSASRGNASYIHDQSTFVLDRGCGSGRCCACWLRGGKQFVSVFSAARGRDHAAADAYYSRHRCSRKARCPAWRSCYWHRGARAVR